MKIYRLFPLFFCFLTISCNSNTKQNVMFIKNVYDGDTFGDKWNNTYRLYGVDTPELHNQYKNFETTSGIEYLYANDACIYSSNLILNKMIHVVHMGIDKYKRQIDNRQQSLPTIKTAQTANRCHFLQISSGSLPFKMFCCSTKYLLHGLTGGFMFKNSSGPGS